MNKRKMTFRNQQQGYNKYELSLIILLTFVFPYMRRNNTYSLQKINPNISSRIHYQSRVAGLPRSRLSFPQIGDSGYYGGVGRKHYEKNTNFIHKLILNPDYGKNPQPMPRSKSENYLKIGAEIPQNQQNIKLPKKQLGVEPDSLTKLSEQVSKKLALTPSPEKYNKINQNFPPNSEIPQRKSSLNPNQNLFKIFSSVDKIYDIVCGARRQDEQNSPNKRKFNPTFLSSDLGYV